MNDNNVGYNEIYFIKVKISLAFSKIFWLERIIKSLNINSISIVELETIKIISKYFDVIKAEPHPFSFLPNCFGITVGIVAKKCK